MDAEKGLILGCPYGGVNIIWKKSFISTCVRNYDTSRIIGLVFT